MLLPAGPSPAAAQPPQGEAELVIAPDRAFAIFPDGRVAHRRASERTWTQLPPMALCSPVRRLRGPAPLAAVTSDGTLWVAHGGCLSRWNGAQWIAERASLGSISTLASAGNEVVLVVSAPDYRGGNYAISRRSLHGSGRGWRVHDLPSLRPHEHHDVTRLAVRGPDDMVLVGSGAHARDAGLTADRSYRFDGRRWRSASTIREAVRDAVALSDGRLFALSEDRSLHVGWPGSSWTRAPFPEGGWVARIEGTPDDFWATLFVGTAQHPRPGGIQRWQSSNLVEQIAFDARGVRRFGQGLLAWDRAGIYDVQGGGVRPITLGPAPAATWPSAQQAVALGLAPIQPDFRSQHSGETFAATLTARAAGVQLGGARVALIATPADAPGECPVEHQFSLVRLEADRVVARRELGPPSCGGRAPLVEASLEARDVDADGRVELLVRFPAQARHLELAMLAIVDPEGLRVEGALVTDVNAQIDTRQTFGNARLYLRWDIDAAGQTLTRDAVVWTVSGVRARAPRLAPCRRDPARDSWACPGDSLETAVVRTAPCSRVRRGEDARLQRCAEKEHRNVGVVDTGKPEVVRHDPKPERSVHGERSRIPLVGEVVGLARSSRARPIEACLRETTSDPSPPPRRDDAHAAKVDSPGSGVRGILG